MGSPNLARVLVVLVRKEVRVLLDSRVFWLMLLVSCALTGHAFADALRFYAEASGSGGGPSALAQSLSPLDGIIAPVFGAFDLVATLVFPFVVIRLFAIERESGELALSLQIPAPFWIVVAAKTIALYVAWLVSLALVAIALAVWVLLGGHLAAGETMVVVAGYLLRGFLTIGIGAAACSMTASASSAAIVALTITLGTWMLDYAAAASGGFVAVLSAYTPAAALRTFERGELRIETAVIVMLLSLLGVALWGISVQTGKSRGWRVRGAAIAVVATGILCASAALLSGDFDLSEDQRNSFPRHEQELLSRITEPLAITVYLAAEDPRLTDFDHGVLHKLRRTVPHVVVTYAAKSRSGLFETSTTHYGEIWYELNGRRVTSRSVAEPVVLETLHELLGVNAPVAESAAYPGYPARMDSGIVSWLYFAIIPLAIIFAWWRVHIGRVDTSNLLLS